MNLNCVANRFVGSAALAMAMLFSPAAFAQVPSIEGTYQLVSRTLADATVIRPPDMSGLWTYTKGHRNLNIVRKDAAGKVTSRHLVSTYKLTPNEYSETLLFHVRTDQIGGKETVYEVAAKTAAVPIKIEGRRIEVKLPFEPPTVVFDGNRITARGGGFVDVWEKVE